MGFMAFQVHKRKKIVNSNLLNISRLADTSDPWPKYYIIPETFVIHVERFKNNSKKLYSFWNKTCSKRNSVIIA